MSMNFNWTLAQPTNGQAAFDAAQAALQNKRNNAYTQNMSDRQVGNANDMMSWMQQGNDAVAYQQEQAAAAAQQAQQAQQEAAQKQSQIDSIKARINELESQIAANQAKLKNWQGVGGQVAALEARKINTQDPTSIWRWKQGQDQAMAIRKQDLERIEKEKAKTKEEQKQAFMNKLNATLPTMSVNLNTSPEQAQMYKNTLANLEADAANYNVSDPRIAEIKNALYGDLPYNAMMSAIDELEDINANYGKGSEYDKMTEAQKFNVFRNKLENARQNLIDTNPTLWEMMMRDSRYRNKFNNLLSGRKPKSKGKDPVRAAK